MIDSHAHLFYEDFRADFEQMLERARMVGVRAIVVPGTNVQTSREAVDLSARYPSIFACVGIHPHEAGAASDADVESIRDLTVAPGVVAVGEIGLDFHYDFSPRTRQQEIFHRQVLLAVEMDLPIVVHTRESIPEALDIVRSIVRDHPDWCVEQAGEKAANRGRGVFHCFTGTAEQARELFSMGFLVSYPGIVTFKNSPVVPVIREIGLENILIETDSPYLAPVPHRGKRNEPSHLPVIAGTIAVILGATPSEVARRTSENAIRLFALNVNVGTAQHF
jgi:TatD DNase family protein